VSRAAIGTPQALDPAVAWCDEFERVAQPLASVVWVTVPRNISRAQPPAIHHGTSIPARRLAASRGCRARQGSSVNLFIAGEALADAVTTVTEKLARRSGLTREAGFRPDQRVPRDECMNRPRRERKRCSRRALAGRSQANQGPTRQGEERTARGRSEPVRAAARRPESGRACEPGNGAAATRYLPKYPSRARIV
jgi:hypothetical protein